jgi:hypothetical protein
MSEIFKGIAKGIAQTDIGKSAIRKAEDWLDDLETIQTAANDMLPKLDPKVQEAVDTAINFSPAGVGMISPKLAKSIKMATELPKDKLFQDAVNSIPGAKITTEGLELPVSRFQKAEQAGEESVRTGVFYLPQGSPQERFYKTGKVGYGGGEKIEGLTLVKKPLFVKGGTGGKAPEAALIC